MAELNVVDGVLVLKGHDDLVTIRNKVCSDLVALEKWSSVVDHIIKQAADVLSIKRQLKESEYREAVLQSLTLWHSYGADRANLPQVLQIYGLKALSDSLLAWSGTSSSGVGSSIFAPVWFEVPEVPHNFTGREVELTRLHQLITGSHSSKSTYANVASVSGLGGIGKSALASEFAFKHTSDFDGNVIWVNGANSESMRSSFLRLSEHIGLVQLDERTPTKILVTAVYKWFGERKSLFIFDNVEEKRQFQEFQPKIGTNKQTPHVLITSRLDNLASLRENRLKLDVVSMDAAVRLIRKELATCSKEDAEKLALCLQRLPLALLQALAYINDVYLESDQNAAAKYIAAFHKNTEKLLADSRFQEENDYTLTVRATWSVTLKRIKAMDKVDVTTSNTGKAALRIIRAMSYLNPDRISQQFLARIFGEEDTTAGLKLLHQFSMVNVNGKGIASIHRLVQCVVRLDVEHARELKFLFLLISTIGIDFDWENLSMNRRESLLHAQHIFPFQVRHDSLMEDVAYLGLLCQQLTFYKSPAEAFSIAETSAMKYETLLGPGHENTLTMKEMVVVALLEDEKPAEAQRILESILPLAVASYGEKDTRTTSPFQALSHAVFCILEAEGKFTDGRSTKEELETLLGAYHEAIGRAFESHPDQLKLLELAEDFDVDKFVSFCDRDRDTSPSGTQQAFSYLQEFAVSHDHPELANQSKMCQEILEQIVSSEADDTSHESTPKAEDGDVEADDPPLASMPEDYATLMRAVLEAEEQQEQNENEN